MKKIAAFFDIDGTIFRDSLMIEHYKLLVKNKLVDESNYFGELKYKYQNWQQRNGDYDEYLLEVADIYVEALKNVSKDDIDYMAKRVIEMKSNKVYTYTRDAIKEHLEKGHYVFIISGSPDFLVKRMGEKLNVTKSIGSIYLINENNHFSGKVIPMWDSKSKIKAIKNLEKEYMLDLDNSYAYGDTTGDYGMFEMVGNPIAINPAKRLFNKIKSNEEMSKKIKVIIERKDMIYILNANTKYLKEGENIL